MRWRKSKRQGERADVVIDLRQRLAPYIDRFEGDDEVETACEPVAVLQAGAPGPYRPRHLAT